MGSALAYKKLVEESETALWAGRIDEVARRLSDVAPSKVPRVWRLPLAHLCRRAGCIHLGLRILSPVVRPVEVKSAKEASPAEKTEYAILLQRGGAVREALNILRNIDPLLSPEVRIARIHCYFGMWDYEAALPEIRAYLERPQTKYFGLVTRLNLAAALVAIGKYEEAFEPIHQALSEAKALGMRKFEGNAYELLAQIHVAENNREKAVAALLSAATHFTSTKSLDHLYVEKWQAVLEAKRTGEIDRVKVVRQKALALRHWETVRDCDLRMLEVCFDQNRFNHLYFGTPYQSYRNKIVKLLGRQPNAEAYLLGSSGRRVFDLETGAIEGGKSLQRSGKILSLLQVLFRDFYRPVSMGGVFSELFVDEYFNVNSSPNRVAQIISRTRRWLKESDLALAIEITDGAARASLGEDVSVRVPLESGVVDPHLTTLEILRGKFSEQAFTAVEGCALLGLSSSGFRGFLNWALEAGEIEKYGASTSTVYYLKSKPAA